MKRIIKNITCLLFSCLLLFSMDLTMAQEKVVIRGVVTSSKDKSPIPGAVVSELDKDGRTINAVPTDMNGAYALKVTSLNNTIQIQIIGCKTQLLKINNRKTIDVELDDDSKVLDEVIVEAKSRVNANGLNIDEKDIAQSYQKINTKDLEGVAAASIDDALQGRLAGVDISASSGNPGAGMQIRIRGAASLNADVQPLIVVDGMPFETTISSDFNFATADEEQYAQMLSIAPSDIKDITVLTDAASTVQWGTKGANGVLYITTKRGEKGKPKINYSFTGNMTFLPDPIPMLNGSQYSQLIPEEYMNAKGIPLDPTTRKEFQNDPNDPWWYNNYSNNTNWIKEITQQGYKQEHSLSLSGGDKARYYMSVGYLNQVGSTIGTGYQRISTRLNLDYNVSEKIKFSTSIAYTHGTTQQNYDSKVRDKAYTRMPNMSVYEINEQGVNTGNYLSPLATPTGTNLSGNAQGKYFTTVKSGVVVPADGANYNVVAMVKEASIDLTNDRVTPNFNLDYNIGHGFYFKGILGFDISSDKTEKFLPAIATGLPLTDINVNNSFKATSDYFNVSTQATLSYSPKIGKNQDLSMALSEATGDAITPYLTATTSNSASSNLSDPTSPSVIQSVYSTMARSRYFRASFAGQYKLLDRYIINGGVTREGNSKLSKNYRFGYFPTISAKWQMIREPLLKPLTKIFSELSVKASLARTGNLNFNKQTYSTYSAYGYNYIDVVGIYQTQPELSDLKWEQIIAKNLAVEMVFKNGTTLTLEAYKRNTNDVMSSNEAVPTSSGYSTLASNVGELENSGWTILFRTTLLKAKKGSINFDFNIARDVNRWRKISAYASSEADLAQKTIVNSTFKTYQLVDRPLGGFYGYRYKGVYVDDNATVASDSRGNQIVDGLGNPINMRFNYSKSNTGYAFQGGDAIYQDVNHDGNINYMDVVYLGNSNPKFTGGFNLSANYGPFRVGFYFYYKYKFDIVNASKISLEAMTNYDNQSTAVLRRWRNPGDKTNIPRAVYGFAYNSLASDRYVEDGSFLRLKTVTLSYAPRNLAKKLRLNNLSFYTTLSNLWTLTNYTGQDPEVSGTGSTYYVAYDSSKTPRTIDVNFGIQIGF